MRLESLRSYVYISDIILILYSRIIANTIKIAGIGKVSLIIKTSRSRSD